MRIEELQGNLKQRRWLQNSWQVKKLIEKFESHQHKESFLQDLSHTQKINKFSK